IHQSYYHPSYPIFNPDRDLILESSDLIPCRFAICSKKFNIEPELFSRHPHQIQLNLKFPLIKLNQSKEVIEVILFCLDSKILPDLSLYTFDTLVSALEVVAGRLELIHVERLCLFAIGAYYKTKPVQVFALAEIYGCDWMMKVSSEFTLSLNINLPKHKSLLSSEAYQALVEPHSNRRRRAREILNSLRFPIPFPNHPSSCQPNQFQEFWKGSFIRLNRIIWISQADLSLKEIFLTELQRSKILLDCDECVKLMKRVFTLADQEFSKLRTWSLPTSNSSQFGLPR
ncbi:hypothetical protein DFH28DRAFT_886969, partial [Melampsora americana]